MYIRKVHIENIRSIEKLDWEIPEGNEADLSSMHAFSHKRVEKLMQAFADVAEPAAPLAPQPLRLGQSIADPVPPLRVADKFEFNLAPKIGAASAPLSPKPVQKEKPKSRRNWLF